MPRTKVEVAIDFHDEPFCGRQTDLREGLFLGKDGGTRALCQGCKSYRTKDTFTDGTQAPLAPKATLVPDKSGKRRRKWLAYIVIELDWVPEKIHHQYRRRFGIECSYRIMRRVRAMTTSLNPVNPRT
jgi:hypothetical protein